jgi:hypothetical protein
MLAQLSDPAQLVQVLSPTTDVTHSRLLTLLGAAYDMPEATIHDVRDLQVQHSEIERPVFLPKRTEGTLMETTAPEFRRTALSLQRSDLSGAIWIDLAAEVGLTLVLEIDPGEVDSIVTRELDNFTSLADFQSRFRFIDMNAFMAQLRVSTFEEFKSRYQFAMTEIRLKSVAAFDPNDATNQQRFTLDIAVLIRDSIDVAAALRDAKLARTALESTVQYKPEPRTRQ